jgi:hypothetical protein
MQILPEPPTGSENEEPLRVFSDMGKQTEVRKPPFSVKGITLSLSSLLSVRSLLLLFL